MDKVTELREALAKATDCKLEEDGEYFEEGRYCDLTQCHHGETGRYQNRHDGKLIALLWNNRHALIDALSTPAPDSEKLREALTTLLDETRSYLADAPVGHAVHEAIEQADRILMPSRASL